MYFIEIIYNFIKKEIRNIMRGMQEKGSKIMLIGDIKGYNRRELFDYIRGILIFMGGLDYSQFFKDFIIIIIRGFYSSRQYKEKGYGEVKVLLNF